MLLISLLTPWKSAGKRGHSPTTLASYRKWFALEFPMYTKLMSNLQRCASLRFLSASLFVFEEKAVGRS